MSQEQLDAGFVEYSKIHEQQVEARASADRLLHYALGAFTGLRAITPGFVDEIIDNVRFDHCSKIQDIARKTLLADRFNGPASSTSLIYGLMVNGDDLVDFNGPA